MARSAWAQPARNLGQGHGNIHSQSNTPLNQTNTKSTDANTASVDYNGFCGSSLPDEDQDPTKPMDSAQFMAQLRAFRM